MPDVPTVENAATTVELTTTQKTTLLGNSLIWFGAAVSIAEILTGSLLAPLGFAKAAAAIIGGHLIGCILLYFAGLIGARYGVTAMEGVKRSFGAKGGILFAVLNLIQLIGWTAVMIAAGAQSAHGILPLPPWGWAVIIGGMIAVWITLKASELKWLNCAAVALLFLLSLLLSTVIFRGNGGAPCPADTPLSFGEALELSIAMPLSWLPLIADYTRSSNSPKTVSLISASVYFLVSCWMYLIGLGAALFAGGTDIAQLLTGAGFGIPALLIVVFSTVTTTYLDVYSSEMSAMSIAKRIPATAMGLCVCLAGVLMAIFCNTGAFEQFLYWIGSVFAPMIAIQVVDFFLLKQADADRRPVRVSSLIIWALGFLLYRILLTLNPVCGSTIPVMLFTAAVRFGWGKFFSGKSKNA